MKTIGYYLFSLIYYICRPLPIIKKRVLCIMTHDDGDGGNVSIAMKAIKGYSKEYTFSYITKSDTMAVKRLSDVRKLFIFFFQKPYQIARAEIILMDNVFLPFAFIKRKKKTKVIQLWHGTGTIKKFGQDVNTGRLKKLEKKANKNITHLIVNAAEMKELYAGAFGIREELVIPIGLPKTDELLQRIKKVSICTQNPYKQYIYQKYEIPMDKKLILYAPTFRDEAAKNQDIPERINELISLLPEEYFLGLRLHPYIAGAYKNHKLKERVCQLSFERDLNAILMAADLLITDYSSIVFDYCVTERPMIFYAYDFEEFSSEGRGFYYDYESYVPGPVISTVHQLADVIIKEQYDYHRIREFKDNSYEFLDGEATGRLIQLLLENEELK